MNRRGFISMIAGAAGAPLVPWRGIVEPRIFLPEREPLPTGILMVYDAIREVFIPCSEWRSVVLTGPPFRDGYVIRLPAWSDGESVNHLLMHGGTPL